VIISERRLQHLKTYIAESEKLTLSNIMGGNGISELLSTLFVLLARYLV
jgi:histidinol-phosphate/aromatic aminotransferase/cobyric acid decarboxylase-like protein